MTQKEDAFCREVEGLKKYTDETRESAGDMPGYLQMAATYREIARRAMTCAFRAEEAAQEAGEGGREVITAYPRLEPE